MSIIILSGFISVLCVWAFLVIPTIIAKIDLNKFGYSKLINYPSYRRLYFVGVISFPLFQIIHFTFNVSFINQSVLFIFIIGNIFSMLILIFTLINHPKIHNVLVHLYVLLTWLALFFHATSVTYGGWILFLLLLAGIFGLGYFIRTKRIGIGELWYTVFASIWTITFYFVG